MLAAVNYHYIRPSFDFKYPSIFGVTPKKFERQLDLLGKSGSFVSQGDIVDAIKGKSSIPKRSILITFDDGLKEQFQYALPILNRKGIPAVFYVNLKPLHIGKISSVHKIHILRSKIASHFIFDEIKSLVNPSENIEYLSKKAKEHYKYDTKEAAQLKYYLNFVLDFRIKEELIDRLFLKFTAESEADMVKYLYMNKTELSILARQNMLGSHSYDHLPLGLLSREEQLHQIHLSKKLIEEWTHITPISFSYPYGSKAACGNLAPKLLKKHNFYFALTTERSINLTLNTPYYLSRFDNNDMPGGKATRFKKDEIFT